MNIEKAAPRQPVTYTVMEKSLVGNEIFEAGQSCQYDGLPSSNLQPTCDIGRARAQEYIESNAARVKAMIDQNKEDASGLDPQAFMANMLKVQTEMAAEQAERQTVAIAAAVAQAVAQTIAAMFPNGVPSPAPVAPAIEQAPVVAAAAADSETETKQEEGSADTGAPAKRSKG